MPAIEHRDFEIHVLQQQVSAGNVVVARVPSSDLRAEGTFRSPYSAAEINRALEWMERGDYQSGYVQTFGADLFRALFQGEVRDLYASTRHSVEAPLRLRLIVDPPELARIPWELLYDPDAKKYLSQQWSMVRGISSLEPTRPLKTKPPLRILVMDAFPTGVPVLDSQLETASIREALSSLSKRGLVEIETLSHATLPSLQNVLREATSLFHVLHFIGHGQYDAEAEKTLILLENTRGEVDLVDPARLASVLQPYYLRLVFINACQSLHSSALDSARGFAPALMDIGVPAVIGMQMSIADQTAKVFAQNFYAGLADGQDVDQALFGARHLLQRDTQTRGSDLGIPVCYLRTATGQILDLEQPSSVPLGRSTWQAWLRQQATPRRAWAAVFGLLALVSTILGIYWGVVPFLERTPPMTGDFNIAIAEFGEIDDQGRVVRSEEGLAWASSVATELTHELDDLRANLGPEMPLVEVRTPEQTGRLRGNSLEERTRSAEKLADKIKADLVVYGDLAFDSGKTAFVPEFYLSDRQLEDAWELPGQYELGSPLDSGVDIRTNSVARSELRGQLTVRAQALAQFVIGLGYYAFDQYDKALEQFQQAENVSGWDSNDGKEVLFLFLGNAANKLGRPKEAIGYYGQAVQLNKEYARAWLGLAEVEFLAARGEDCSAATVDPAGLERAQETILKSENAAIKPPSANIPEKIAFGRARIDLCRSQSGLEPQWNEAEAGFLQVINGNDSPSRRLRDLQSEAEANLALTYWQRPYGDEEGLRRNRELAVEHYQKAIEMNDHADRQALFYFMLGQLYNRLGEYEESDKAFAEAIGLDPAKAGQYGAIQQKLAGERTYSASP